MSAQNDTKFDFQIFIGFGVSGRASILVGDSVKRSGLI